MSECPEYQDPEVKDYFENIYSDKGKTLAQKFYTLLNNRALYVTDQISGFVLPFHCYSEPNGDVVFTKNRRTINDYDADGKKYIFLLSISTSKCKFTTSNLKTPQ